jgi:hypothetical protein
VDNNMELEMEVASAAGGLDLQKVADLVRSLAEQLAQLQEMLPVDAGEQAAADVDEGAAEVEAEQAEEAVLAPPSDDKEAAKTRAAALLAKTLR